MAEASQFVFSFQELAGVLVKQQNIHDGHWGLFVKFGIQAANVAGPDGNLLPTALVPILEIGIQRFDQPNSLSVDASVVNPPKSKASKKRR
jgi:hypothetical protein